jgi:hypothetical protein
LFIILGRYSSFLVKFDTFLHLFCLFLFSNKYQNLFDTRALGRAISAIYCNCLLGHFIRILFIYFLLSHEQFLVSQFCKHYILMVLLEEYLIRILCCRREKVLDQHFQLSQSMVEHCWRYVPMILFASMIGLNVV